MRLDQQAGDHAALHRRFRQLEAGLKRDLDAPVSADTQRLFCQLTTVGPVGIEQVGDKRQRQSPGIQPQRRVEPPILVISPFGLIGDARDGALLAHICHDDLQTALGGLRDLRVLSIQDPSTDRLKAASASSIASYALEGAVRADGDGWRINLRLTGIDSGLLVWTRQLVVGQTDLLPAIDDLVARIAGAILPVVERDVGRILESADQDGPAAYPLYFAARARLLSATSLADVREAAALLEESIEHDPNLTNAYLHLARLYNTDFMQLMAGHDPAPLRARAFELCARAVALEPGNGNVHSRLGWCYLRRGDARQAEQKFTTALELTPFHADGLNEIGFGLSHLGALDQARTLIARAFEYNPFPPDEYFSDLAVLLAMAGEHDAAEAQFEISRNPSIHYLAVRAANLAMLGREKMARTVADELRKDFAPIWQKREAASDGDIVAVMMQFLPLQGDSERGLFLEGLNKAGFRFDQQSIAA
jgi:Tfp pilus assembly protein PilF/TolB-like protein